MLLVTPTDLEMYRIYFESNLIYLQRIASQYMYISIRIYANIGKILSIITYKGLIIAVIYRLNYNFIVHFPLLRNENVLIF